MTHRTVTGLQREKAVHPIDSSACRKRLNTFLSFEEHRLTLQAMTNSQRESALLVIEASYSAAGCKQAREAMRMNGALGGSVSGYEDTLTEFLTACSSPA